MKIPVSAPFERLLVFDEILTDEQSIIDDTFFRAIITYSNWKKISKNSSQKKMVNK